MSLKAIVETLEGIPEALHPFYTKSEDGAHFVLDADVETHPAVKGLKNSLTNAREERRVAKEAVAKFDGIDLDKYKLMEENERKIQEGKLLSENKIEELVTLRINAFKSSVDGEIKKHIEEKLVLQQQMDRLVIDNAVQTAAAKHGVRKAAMDDILYRARAVFKARDGVAVAYKDDAPVYSKDGTSMLGIDEWMSSLPANAPHLFEESKGSGAPGGSAKAPVAGPGSVSKGDAAAFLANLDAIAKAKVRLV